MACVKADPGERLAAVKSVAENGNASGLGVDANLVSATGKRTRAPEVKAIERADIFEFGFCEFGAGVRRSGDIFLAGPSESGSDGELLFPDLPGGKKEIIFSDYSLGELV